MEIGHFTRQEIFSQPEAWSAALKVLANAYPEIKEFNGIRNFDQIIFTGCGSTYYLAIAAAALTQEFTGCSSRALPASELWLYPRSAYSTNRTLLIAVSRSGETTETLRACESFLTAKQGKLVTLTCYEEAQLAKMGSMNIVLPSGQEQSVAQTRAFSTLYLGTVALACVWSGRKDLFDSLFRLPGVGMPLLTNYSNLAAEIGRSADLDRFYWLGSGPRYGLACELSLKMKEMTLSHSEPFHFMEFRHGPISMISPSALVIGLRSTVNSEREGSVLEDILELGGRTIDIAESDASVNFESGLEECVRNVLYLPFGQMIAFERALSKGLNPDKPTNLESVVKLAKEES